MDKLSVIQYKGSDDVQWDTKTRQNKTKKYKQKKMKDVYHYDEIIIKIDERDRIVTFFPSFLFIPRGSRFFSCRYSYLSKRELRTCKELRTILLRMAPN